MLRLLNTKTRKIGSKVFKNQQASHKPSAGIFWAWLRKLGCENAQKEYYLTDIVALAVAEGVSVGGVIAYHPEGVLGVNDRWQQVELERFYQRKQAKRLALLGVHIADDARLDIRGRVSVDVDTFIDVNVVLEGDADWQALPYWS